MPALFAVIAVTLALACSSNAAETIPTPVAPAIDPRLAALSQGTLDFDIPGGGNLAIDPLELASLRGNPPTCAGFVFLFSWSTSRSRSLKFTGNRQGGEFDIGRGAAGQASVTGRILLPASNESNDRATGQVRYVIAESPRPGN